jgi:hypothetical protein
MTDKLKRVYEWAVIGMAFAVLVLTAGATWFEFIDGELVNIPVIFNDPHAYTLPLKDHPDRLARDITHLTTQSTYRRGEMVYAYVDVVKTRKLPGELQWQLMDQRFYPYVKRRGVLPEGHLHQIVPIERVPLHIPPGQYHFSGTVTYEINFAKDIHIPLRTNCFQVVDESVEFEHK